MTSVQDLCKIRPGVVTVMLPEKTDAAVYFIGRISTPWKTRTECSKRGGLDNGPICRIELAEHWQDALAGVKRNEQLQVLYWIHQARRDLILQSSQSDGRTKGTLAIRSPNRPNPIAFSLVSLVDVEGTALLVRGLDCIDGTPLTDVNPELCPHAG
jgi:tRNA (adenine37-N6)-methyltransferase